MQGEEEPRGREIEENVQEIESNVLKCVRRVERSKEEQGREGKKSTLLRSVRSGRCCGPRPRRRRVFARGLARIGAAEVADAARTRVGRGAEA